MRGKVAAFIDQPRIQNAIIWVIVINAIALGMETSDVLMSRIGGLILLVDKICLSIFVIEIVTKLYARGLRFFTSAWSVFDFVIIGIALVPAAQALSALRALRILRVLRVISVAPRLRRVVEGFLTALPSMGSVFLLMAVIFYIGAVISTKLFGDSFPEWFGDLGLSAYSLFQIMTLESWSMGIVRPVMEVYPFAWVFFVPFIMATTFVVANLLVGLIVNSMQDAHHEDDVEETGVYRHDLVARLEAIEKKLDALSQQK